MHDIIEVRNPGAATLLDVACGTGLELSYLRTWYEVAGVDRSHQMLEVARQRLGDGVPLLLGDMRTFDLGRTFDAVTCLFSSISYGNLTSFEFHHLVRDKDTIEYFIEHHRSLLVATAEYVRAAEACGLIAEVATDFMPGRDRIIGVKPP